MKVIIPIAGIGTRLRPHTHTAPKGLLHVAGKPILGHILDRLKKLNVSEIIFIIGFLGERIADYVKKNYNFKSSFVYQEELKGLAYALNLVSPRIKKDEPLLIILGDTIIEANLGQVLRKKQNALGTHWVDDPRRFGIVEKEKGWVKRLVEKPEHPTSHQAIVGVYYIADTPLLKECLKEIIGKKIKTKGEYQLTDALQLMINQGAKFSTFEIGGWYDCGKPETLLETNQHLLGKMKVKRKIPGSVLIPPVYVSPTSKIIDSVVGPFVSVADDAVIRNSIIRNSIVGEEAEISFCLLESSLVGFGAEVNGTFQRLNVGDSSVVGVY
jgi:glucose-1-phosphate thymidylyltransferase